MVNNPTVIVEVLSNSRRDYDLGRKFEYYRTLDCLQEYILVDSNRVLFMIYHRSDSQQWSLTILENPTDILTFSPLPISISLTDISEGVNND